MIAAAAQWPHSLKEAYEKSLRGDFATVGDVATFDDEGFSPLPDLRQPFTAAGQGQG